MLFLTFNNAKIQFSKKKLIWKSYITAKALLTTKQVGLIDKKNFVKVALDENFETFVVHIVIIEAQLSEIMVHPSREAQITTLKYDEASINDPAKYSDFSDIFSEKKALLLLKRIDLNGHAIKLKEDK